MASPSQSLAPWKPGRDEWNVVSATHLLERAAFGPGPGDAAHLAKADHKLAIDGLFSPIGHNPQYLSGIEILLGTGDIDHLAAWWIGLIIRGGDNLRERIALMWHDHFATSNVKVDDIRLMHGQNQLFREEGMGDFRNLFHKVAKDPCMLTWLDGDSNRVGQPNENFAREVMELFALGIGNYSEEDVQELARALSGWGTKGRAFRFREKYHDSGTKTILGKTGEFGPEQGLDIILAQPATARHIARRLLAEFITTTPSEQLVEAAADTLVRNDWQIEATVKVLVSSEAFFAADVSRTRIASPVELIARAVRILSAEVAPSALAAEAAEMGQSLFEPPSVKGWDGMEVWINAGTWTARHNASARLASSDVDYRAAMPSAMTCTTKEAAAREAVALLLPALANTKAGQVFSSTVAKAAEKATSKEDAIALATALVLTSPEYQLV